MKKRSKRATLEVEYYMAHMGKNGWFLNEKKPRFICNAHSVYFIPLQLLVKNKCF